ncbi:hypothetical protein H6771_00435 [Candidatus Peribacteria bacterium]|nr:hypothetical protein [Candidatus Peribacteria bacterium]
MAVPALRTRAAGESLIEVLLAVSILATVLSSIYMLFGQVLRTDSFLAQRTEALLIASSSIEAVYQWRDTNALRYGAELRDYWRCVDTPVQDCSAQVPLFGSQYRAMIEGDRVWLTETPGLDIFSRPYRLYEQDDGLWGYTVTAEPMPYFHWLTLSYDPSPQCGRGAIVRETCTEQRITAHSTVAWGPSDRERLTVSAVLYDLYNREHYGD